MKTIKDYPVHLKELTRLMTQYSGEHPDVMKAFNQLVTTTLKGGALDQKTKELIALGIAIAVRCDGCISFHVHSALKASASHPEIVEAIGVSILMGGGPAMMYGVEAYEALKQFEALEKT